MLRGCILDSVSRRFDDSSFEPMLESFWSFFEFSFMNGSSFEPYVLRQIRFRFGFSFMNGSSFEPCSDLLVAYRRGCVPDSVHEESVEF